MAWGGAARRAARGWSIRTTAGRDLDGAAPASRRRSGGAVRRGRAADGPRRPAGGHARLRDRAGDRWRRSGPGRARRGTCRASGSRPSSRSSSPRRSRRSGCGRSRRPGSCAGISPELAAQRGVAQNKAPRRGPLGSHRPDGRRRAGGSPDRPARGARPRHRQAGDVRRRRFIGPRDGRRGAGRGAPGPAALPTGDDRPDRPPRPQAHVRVRARAGAIRRSAGSSPRSATAGARRAVRAAPGGQRRERADGRRGRARRASGPGRRAAGGGGRARSGRPGGRR